MATYQPLESPFSGRAWEVKSGRGGPRDNRWRSGNVTIDDDGDLEMRIVQEAGAWSCAEIRTADDLHFGTYQVFVTADLTQIARNGAVLGFFNYPSRDEEPLDETDEIDIEIGEFQQFDGRENLIFHTYPSELSRHETMQHTRVDLTAAKTTLRFTWSSGAVHFQFLEGHRDDDRQVIHEWRSAPRPRSRLPQRPLPFHINYWLLWNQAPIEPYNAVITLSSFRHLTPA